MVPLNAANLRPAGACIGGSGCGPPRGETEEELTENLRDIYAELTSGNIPGVRRVAELHIA